MPGSHSRQWGAAVVGAVLLALVLVPALDPRPVTGVAIAAPVPGPPEIGDCVTEPIDPDWQSINSAARVSTYAYPRLDIARCDGARYGEVTGVIVAPIKPVVTTTAESTTVSDANMEKCASNANRFVGKAMAGALPAVLFTFWYPQFNIATAAVTPSIRQQAAGQHWSACIGYLQRLSGAIESFATEEKYSGTIRNALVTGNQRNRTSTCVATTDLTGARIGDIQCSSRHHGEVFAYGFHFGRPVTRVALQWTCEALVRQVTGIADIVAAGLRIDIGVTDGNEALVSSKTVTSSSFARCGVVVAGQRTLDGSLLALGSGPVPWSP